MTLSKLTAWLLFPLLALAVLGPVGVLAQGSFEDNFSGGATDVFTILENLTKTMRTILLPLLTLTVFWAGYTMATAQGNEQQYSTGKKILINALIGTAVVSVAPLLVQVAREFREALR